MAVTVEDLQEGFKLKDRCEVQHIALIPEQYFSGIDCLSLDCFDTIIWRSVYSPPDIFYLMAEMSIFKKYRINAEMRMALEETARRRKQLDQHTREVTLTDIYRAYSRKLTDEEINELIAAEMSMELEHTYAFTPIVELMQAAFDQKKKIIIISDTYFSKKEVRALLQKHLPSHIFNALTVYTSCDQGKNKSQGVHLDILKSLNIKPERCLHIGDNKYVDYKVPKQNGIKSLHLVAHDDTILKMHRIRNLGLGLVDNDVHAKTAIHHPFAAIFSSQQSENQSDEKYLGYVTLGPMMYAFANYISQEAEKLKKDHQNVKLMFLLRDANLPHKIVNIINPGLDTHAVRISRFAAYAASFCSKQDVVDYLATVISGGRFKDICKQLQVPLTKIEKVLKAEPAKQSKMFEKIILSPEIITLIISNSTNYRKRLMRYLENQAGVKSGDTLIFVDLGYSGTTQSRLAPVFKKEYNIDIVGRYLISLSVPEWQQSRAGLLDPSHYDDRLLLTLVTYIAMLEQLCTTVDKSVVDFNEKGEPIFADVSLNEDQYEKLSNIQHQCEQFAKDATCLLSTKALSAEVLRQIALAEVVRLIYFPMQNELDYLATFKFDLNLGTQDLIEMYSTEKGLDGLQRRGLFFMEKHAKTMRTNYPAELRANSIELAITLLSQHRYGLQFSVSDVSFRAYDVPIYVLQERSHARHIISARPTHDGYFSLIVPLGKGQYATGIGIGESCHWVQIKALELIPVERLYGDIESLNTKDILKEALFDQMECRDGNLYECTSKASLLLIQPQASKSDMVCRLTFRPIV